MLSLIGRVTGLSGLGQRVGRLAALDLLPGAVVAAGAEERGGTQAHPEPQATAQDVAPAELRPGAPAAERRVFRVEGHAELPHGRVGTSHLSEATG